MIETPQRSEAYKEKDTLGLLDSFQIHVRFMSDIKYLAHQHSLIHSICTFGAMNCKFIKQFIIDKPLVASLKNNQIANLCSTNSRDKILLELCIAFDDFD